MPLHEEAIEMLQRPLLCAGTHKVVVNNAAVTIDDFNRIVIEAVKVGSDVWSVFEKFLDVGEARQWFCSSLIFGRVVVFGSEFRIVLVCHSGARYRQPLTLAGIYALGEYLGWRGALQALEHLPEGEVTITK